MVDDTLKSNHAPEISDKTLEKTVFWAMIVAFVVVDFVMLKSMFV